MKKVIFVVVFCSFLFVSCGDKKAKTKDVQEDPKVEVATEVETSTVDSLAVEIEKAKEDIEEAAKEVDKLLEEL